MSAASRATADIREDEEQQIKFQDCIDLLVACGYFRARIKGLAPFDKIVGGIVWCISMCNYSVDVDLLHSENSTIGERINLTEKIVEVLNLLKCPFAIQPHQIQGLDFIHIFPVIQWLVKKTIEAKKEHGDDLESYSTFNYKQTSHENDENEISHYTTLLSKSYPERYFKRGPNTVTKDILDNALCTLAEYSRSTFSKPDTSENPTMEEALDTMEESVTRDKVSTKVLKKIFDNVVISDDNAYGMTEEEILDMKIKKATKQNEILDQEIEKEKEEIERLQEKVNIFRSETQKMTDFIQNADPKLVKEFQELLDEHDLQVLKDKEFENSCSAEVEKLEEELERTEKLLSVGRLDDRIIQLKAILKIKEEELVSQRSSYAETAKRFYELQQQADEIPSHTEIAQYQQRFLELYNQMSNKHLQTKEYYSVYNTILHVKNFTKKQIDLLSNIEDILPKATSEPFQDSFIQNLQNILKGIELNMEKIEANSKTLEKEKSDLAEEYSQLKEDQRAFIRATEEFEQLCKENADLKKQRKKKEKQ